MENSDLTSYKKHDSKYLGQSLSVSPAAHHLSDLHIDDHGLPTLPEVPEKSSIIKEPVTHTADPNAKFEAKGIVKTNTFLVVAMATKPHS